MTRRKQQLGPESSGTDLKGGQVHDLCRVSKDFEATAMSFLPIILTLDAASS